MARRPRTTHDSTQSGLRRLLTLMRLVFPPVHPAGLPFISVCLAVAVVGRKVRWLRRVGLLAAGAHALFFRHPSRKPPSQPGVVVAAADGVICGVDTAPPPPELGLGPDPVARVSVFLSLFDAHVQRMPIGGEVLQVQHRAGQFRSADRDAASVINERTSVLIRTPEGREVVVVQIAGLLARRIVCSLRPGDQVSIGDTYGLIRFGSRVDIYFPPGSDVVVETGQRALAGETVLAHLS